MRKMKRKAFFEITTGVLFMLILCNGCKIIQNNFDKLKRDIYGNTPKMLEMCDSMGL